MSKKKANPPTTLDHYQTRHIVWKIDHNANSYCTLLKGGPKMHEEGDREPELPGAWLKQQLNLIFEEGGELVLETNRGWDDEGGDCYEAWIVLPEFRKHYFEQYDKETMPPSEGPNARTPELMFELKYIAAHPEQFAYIWAGPY